MRISSADYATKHGLTELEDKVLGGFSDDITEPLPVNLVEASWSNSFGLSVRKVLQHMSQKNLVFIDASGQIVKFFLTKDGKTLRDVRAREELYGTPLGLLPDVRVDKGASNTGLLTEDAKLRYIKANLERSAGEEANASSAYRTRKATADPVTSKLYEHIASEEDGHRAEFNKRLSELESDKAKIKYNALGGYIV